MEKITIRNFGGLKEVEVEVKSINVLIGPQGAGKSITVKLLYFFKSFLKAMCINNYNHISRQDLENEYRDQFINFFPKESWPNDKFEISYCLDNIQITVVGYRKRLVIKKNKILVTITKKLEEIDSLYKDDTILYKAKQKFALDLPINARNSHYFVPAGRSFFAMIQKNIFLLLENKQRLDPFLVQFGVIYEQFKGYLRATEFEKDEQSNKLANQVLNSYYYKEEDEEFLIHEDSRKVNIINASSGQQEILPLLFILETINGIFLRNNPGRNIKAGGITIYIEEPEANLFPEAQKRIIQLLARTFNREGSNVQIIVTTHSPYILSSLNNLLYAGKLAEMADKKEQVNQVIPQAEQIRPDLVCAYALGKGQLNSLIDEESKLISQNSLDAVSDEISIEFGKLLDIEFFDYG